MDFLVHLNKMLFLLLIFGLCPLSLNETKTEVTTTFIRLTYTAIYVVTYTLALSFFGYQSYLSRGIVTLIQDTRSVSRLSQSIFLFITFYATIIVGLCHKKSQTKYFNRMNAFDKKLFTKLSIVMENKRTLTRMIHQLIFVIIAELVLYAIGQFLEGHTGVYVFLFHIGYGCCVSTLTLAALHVRNCGILLAKRFSVLYNLLDHITDAESLSTHQYEEFINIFQLVEDLFVLKRKFGKAFGFQLLLNSASDFIFFTIAIYYILMSLVVNGFQWRIAYTFAAFNLTHIVKNVMIVFVMEKLAGQVDDIRKIATKATLTTNKEMSASLDLLFLKMQHMEKTKYITAYDFYPINYAMLYNMGAAIVTHMLILLQFHQWEDSQKLLHTADNTAWENLTTIRQR